MTNSPFKLLQKLSFGLLLAAFCLPNHLQAQDEEEDVSFPGLYRKAGDYVVAGNHEEAAKTFERLIDLSGGWETIVEDYGAAAGGLMFDYGMALLQLQRWGDAEAAFTKCRGAAALAKTKSSIEGTNSRENLALFQLGFCKAQAGDHAGAIKLYDEYLASNPSKGELAQIRTGFKLRYGTSQMKAGQMVPGLATIQELFDNRDSWNVTPAFLAQGLFEIGQVWNKNAEDAGSDDAKRSAIETQALDWLAKNGSFLQLQPYDQLQYGFVDRIKPLALKAASSGMYSLSLKYLSYMPTTQQLKDDINIRAAMLGVTTMPAAFAQRLKLIEDRENAEIPPDVEVMRLMAVCYERLGNRMAPRTIYWHLATRYLKLPIDRRAEILHEAAKFSAEMGDYPSAQYFGETFMAEMPEDHPLRNRVATFMIQSLFTAKDYETVIKIAGDVRERFPSGDTKRELADMLYPLSLYSLQRHEDAAVPFDEFVKNYPDSANLETVAYHRASNALILQQFKIAADQIDEFLEKYPDTSAYYENALSDLAVSRYNTEEYDVAIAAADKLLETRPKSIQLGRTLNVKGDSYMIKVNDAEEEDADNILPWQEEALQSYLAAIDAAKLGETEGNSPEYYKIVVAEAMWKAADIYLTQENCEKVVEIYDGFFPNYTGSRWEAQISVFSMECLESVNRGPEGLVQVEKMIVREGTKPQEEQDLQFLREMIGSYSDASVRIRGPEETIAIFNKFPGVPEDDQILATWLKIQNVIVLQGMKADVKKGTPEAEAIQGRIGAVFEELANYDKANLSEYALQQIGLYLAGTENRFTAVPFFEELLNRTNPEADQFKGPADFEIGKIEVDDPAKRASARERFLRVINKYKDPTLIPDAWLELGRLYIADKSWKDAVEALDVINKKKKFFEKERSKRAEATFLLGFSLEQAGDLEAAAKAYLVVWSTYGRDYDWVVQAFERFVPLSKQAIADLKTDTEAEQAEKRKRELDLYKLYAKQMYIWQKLDPEKSFQTEDGKAAIQRLRRELDALKIGFSVTQEEDAKIMFDLGIGGEE